MRKYLFLGGILFFCQIALAQDADFQRQQTAKQIDDAVKIMYSGDYEKADRAFRSILDQATTLPPEICYYFGVNSFRLNKYKQSINWLNKYLELIGTNGEHSESCEEYLALAEDAYLEKHGKASLNLETSTEEDDMAILPSNYDINSVIDCNKYGKIICPVCQGKGVIIKEGLFGKEYNTCPYGDDYGYMSCEDYNLLMQGKLNPNK